MKDALYIAGQLIDLYENTVVATSIEPFDIKDLTKRKVAHTSLIKVPQSKGNLRKLGFLNNHHSQTSVPYQVMTGRYVRAGIEIINGTAYIHRCDDDIEISIFDSTVDLFEQIADRNVTDLDFLPSGPWDDTEIDAARIATSGIVSPVINWGMMTTASVAPDFYLPSMFYNDMVREVLTSTGFTLSGDILTNETFLNLIVPYSLDQWEYPKKFIDNFSFEAYAPVATASVDGKIGATFTDIGGNTEGLFSSVNSELLVPVAFVGITADFMSYDITITTHYLAVGLTGNSFKLQIIHKRSGVETMLAEQLISMPGAPATNGDLELTALAVSLRNSDEVYLKLLNVVGTNTITLEDWVFKGTNTAVIYDTWVFFNYLLPDIDQTDLIRDFYMRFGVIDKLVDSTLRLKTLNEIISDRAGAVDWSSKRVGIKDKIDFEMDYGQENFFRYDDALDNKVGEGSISIANNNLKQEIEIYESPFENCDYHKNFFINCAHIPVYDVTSLIRADLIESPGLKLLLMRDRKSIEQEMGFGITTQTDYKVGVFEQPNEVVGAGFQRAIDDNYPRITSALQKLKVIRRTYVLSDIDISTFDKHKMIFDDGNFIVMSIPNHVPGRPVEVTLFKVD